MSNGWILLHKKIMEWEWWDDAPTRNIFIYLLLKANHKKTMYKGVKVQRGQLITGREKLAFDNNLSQQQVRRVLSNLQTTGEITNKTTNKYTLITINNYESYQPKEPTKNQQTPTQKTDKQPHKKETNETNEIKKSTSRSFASDTLPSPFKEVVKTYEEAFSTSLLAWSPKRKAHVAARLASFPLEHVMQAIQNYAADAFYRGENDRGWKADFDFCVRSDEQIEKGLRLKVIPTAKQKDEAIEENLNKLFAKYKQ
jgi:hypothetical protein